jgi:hypothetical protein
MYKDTYTAHNLIISYDNPNYIVDGWRYLLAYTTTVSTTNIGQWCFPFTISLNEAVTQCNDLSIGKGGYLIDDFYLPSSQELHLALQAIFKNNYLYREILKDNAKTFVSNESSSQYISAISVTKDGISQTYSFNQHSISLGYIFEGQAKFVPVKHY